MTQTKVCVIRTKNKQFLFILNEAGNVIAGFKTALPGKKSFDENLEHAASIYKSLLADPALKVEAIGKGLKKLVKHLAEKYKVFSQVRDTAKAKPEAKDVQVKSVAQQKEKVEQRKAVAPVEKTEAKKPEQKQVAKQEKKEKVKKTAVLDVVYTAGKGDKQNKAEVNNTFGSITALQNLKIEMDKKTGTNG